MPSVFKITFLPSNRTVEYEAGRLPYQQEGRAGSLLDVALNYGIDLRHSSGGVCACTTCHVIVQGGDEHLSAMEPHEEDLICRIPGATLHSRLACRAVACGDVVLRIPKQT